MSHRVVITCIGPALRSILQAETHHVNDPTIRQAFDALLKETPECKNGGVLGLETDNGEAKSGRAKRPPSEYNLFIGNCTRSTKKAGQGKDFKTCSLEWRTRKHG